MGIQCLQFWYHMMGDGIGELLIYTSNSSSLVATGRDIWKLVGSQTDNQYEWLYGQVAVDFDYASQELVILSLDSVDGDRSPLLMTLIGLEMLVVMSLMGMYHSLIIQQEQIQVRLKYPSIQRTPFSSHFIYADHTLGFTAGSRALLYSGLFDATPIGDCMTFWYHLASDRTVGTLRVWELIDGNLNGGPYWISGTGIQPSFWMEAKVNVKASSTFEVVFEAILSDSSNSWLAVDDIVFDLEPCPHPGFCDFDDVDYCYWTNTKDGDQRDWQLNSGSTGSEDTGPNKDHTTGTAQGQYVYFESSNLVAGDTAWLESEILAADDTCFKFWYHMYGKGMGSLNVYTRDQSNQMMMLEWSEHGNHGDRWVEGQVSLSSQNSFNIIMEATFGGNYTGDMALDDTFITQTGLCNDSGIVACDFEEDMCGYTQESDDEFDWTRLSGPTPTSGTGPIVDHTTGTAEGYYVYIETSSKPASNKARLSTPMVQSSASQCLTFWYHMYGMSIDTLNIYTRRNDGQQKLLLVWSLYGEQTDDWLLGNIQLNEPIRYQVIFEGVVGFFSMGDIALDDISIYDGDCPATSTCEFESPTICGYRNDQTDDFDWLRWSGPTPTDNTGPSEDVTYNTQYGHYMYIESDPPQLEGDMARLIGPHMSHVTETTSCWSFYYHMNGQNIGSLEIQLNGNSAVPISLTTITGSQGPTWKRESVEVHATGYEIIFRGVVGNGTEGDIAIDSVDAVERSCLSCDFEDDLCGWENVEDDDFNWIRFKGPTETPGTGPEGDHTIGTPDGFYVLMNSADPRQPGDLAKLTTTFIPSTDAEDMCLTFWYSMVGDDTGTLELSKDDLDGIGSRVFWRLSGQQSSSGWLQATVPYKNAATFEFRGIVGNGNRSDIGLDDLNPVSGKCDVTPPAARVEIPTTTPQPRTTGPARSSATNPATEPSTPKETEATPTINTEQPITGTASTNVMRTEGQTGPEPLAIILGVLGGIVAVFLIVIAAWFITKRRSSSKLEIAALQNNMENPAYDPEGPGGDIVLREMEKKPVEMESRYHTFSPIVEANDGFENPTYASMTSPDDASI